jgi:hypothetical protein
MKKITLALLVLFIAVPLMAGDADAASVDLEGNATTTFGMDLDSGATGLKNSVTAKIEFHLNYPETVITSSGSEDGAIYGEIKLDEIYMDTVDSGDATDVTWDVDVAVDYAKIMGPGFWISLVGPDNSMNLVDSPRDAHLGIVTTYGGGMDMLNYAQSSSGGVEGAYTIDGIATIGASFFSMTDWNDTSDDKNAYGATVELSLSAVENLGLDLGFGMGFGADEASTLNDAMTAVAKLSYKVMLGETMYVQPIVAFDLLMDGDDMSYEIGNGLLVGLGGSSIANSDSTIHYRTAAGAGDGLTEVAFEDDTADGIAVMWDYYQAPGDGVDAVLDIYAEAGVTLIPDAQIALGFAMDDAMGEVPAMGFGAYLGYTLGSAYVDVGYVMLMDNEADGGSQDGLMVANVGLSITDFIPLVDLHVDWWSGNLSADTGEETDMGVVKVAFDLDW